MSDKLYTSSNPNAQQGVRNVLKYLSDITYEKIITGQHTQTMAQEELHLIEKVTGKQPALLGFELLSYSPNINYSDTDDECMAEVTENYGTLKRAWEWAEKRDLSLCAGTGFLRFTAGQNRFSAKIPTLTQARL